MTDAKKKFERNIEAVSTLASIYNYLEGKVHTIDISEILRAQYVLTVSALDFYIHEVIRDGLLKKFDEPHNCTGLKKISIPLQTVKILLDVEDKDERKRILNEKIKSITSEHSYQGPRAIEKALELIDIKKIWAELRKKFREPADIIQKRLALIVNRRNKIAHESDINFLTGEKESIDKQTVKDCSDYVLRFVEEIDCLVENN